jgi:alkylation response protein AidB-like acyl-CoA dehydrogenase
VWIGRGATVAAVVTPELAAAVELREPPSPLSGVDAGQGLAALSVNVEPGDRCVVLAGAGARILWRRWQLLLLADALGCARSVLRRARDHAVTRHQFGRPIATFQAVAHTLADMHVGVTAGESLLAHTAFLLSHNDNHDDSAADEAFAAAACWLPARARKVCEQGIQVHGGTGFTWEYGLHLPYRRVLAVQASLGGRYGSAARVARTGVAG